MPISPAALRALRGRPVTRPLALDEDRALLAELDNRWQLPEHGSSLERQIRFKSFSRAMAFVNCLARLAAEAAAAAQNPYHEWIETYAAAGFEDLAATLDGLLERNAEDRPAVRSAFRRAMPL